MSSRRKYDLSWGRGFPVRGGIRNGVFTHTSTVSPGRWQIIPVPSSIVICIVGSWLGMEFGTVGFCGPYGGLVLLFTPCLSNGTGIYSLLRLLVVFCGFLAYGYI